MTRTLMVAALLIAGCAAEPDFSVNGADVYVVTSAAWAHSPDFPEKLRVELDYAAAYWDLPSDALHGWSIHFVDGGTACDGLPPGCTLPGQRDILIEADSYRGEPITCIECTSMLHEVGHLRFPDESHSGALWASVRDRRCYSAP